MTNTQKLRREIDQQIEAGFSRDQIRQHLLARQYAADEIDKALKQLPSAAAAGRRSSSTGVSIVSILISLYFIITGLVKMSKYPSDSPLYTWGVILLLAGTAGAIWKISEMIRK
ncbi:MAG: hypothetical protein P0Y53_02710 [Candidatus Pseudobacter hemicellulosilyticus]|uniref:Uncharacterized protein n=1 Tax=Candidatus Pseudobacter hemicellulosilyticus TaxID=3121375 RepID=A0AAJ5WSA1_9BACT|nr:MAG: hypothetical protein P0Y53_02710 [Pseudobacter sp.]